MNYGHKSKHCFSLPGHCRRVRCMPAGCNVIGVCLILQNTFWAMFNLYFCSVCSRVTENVEFGTNCLAVLCVVKFSLVPMLVVFVAVEVRPLVS